MTLVTSTSWLRKAQTERWALGAFNANNLEQVQAIVWAAEAEIAPAILQISHRALKYLGGGNSTTGLRFVAAVGQTAATGVTAPVALHLDHGSPREIIQAISLGFTSVMFDGSDLPFEENVSQSKELCAWAHQNGVCFEAELGAVPKPGDPDAGEGALTDAGRAAEFVERTGIDALAISIGSIHACTSQEIELDLDRLADIRSQTNIPLVLHGSSGVVDVSLCAGIHGGLCKINLATQLNMAFTGNLRIHLLAHPEQPDPRPGLTQARAAMQERVQERMRFLGAAGQARGM